MPPVHRRAPSRDAELGKRDDDFRPRSSASTPGLMASLWRWRKRRIVLVFLGIALLYIFVHNIPTDLAPIDERFGRPLRPGHVVHGVQELKEPTGAPPRSVADGDEEVGGHYYNGPIKFYRLATTLRGLLRAGGAKWSNRNVLFAASSLHSVANLMPMACEMARVDRNYVHLAVLGRDPLPLEDILEVNGVDKESCGVVFHDARGDYSEFSSEARAEHSVSGAMKHINDFMHPQAIIMDDSILEDSFFIRAMRKRAKEYRRALIEVPDGRYEDFLWMTRLDSGSLANWFSPSIDILIHASPESSGGLIRLLKSLERADYTGLRPPRLSIELPNDIEHFARQYIESIKWPPDEMASPLRTNALSLRHRIQTSRLNSEQASLRFVESFFPTSTNDDHVLILSSQTEVHPLYLQYLYYIILEYRYSSYTVSEADDLLGISLAVPTEFLNGSSGFEAPRIEHMEPIDDPAFQALDKSSPAPFVYQAPSSTASLIFGDKWTTFHNFLSRRFQMAEAGKSEKHTKQVTETEPAWMEYLLELLTARAWHMLHPAYPMATVHSELAHVPEEYIREMKAKDANGARPDGPLKNTDEPFLVAETAPTTQSHLEPSQGDHSGPLLKLLPFDGELTELSNLPHLYRNGKMFTPEGNLDFQETYVKWFRQHIGGCDAATAERGRVIAWLGADDLFCLPGIPPDFVPLEEETSGDDSDEKAAEEVIRETQRPPVDEGKDGKGSSEKDRDIAGAGWVEDSARSADEQHDGVQVR